jgi:ketosteroid isomerase-like protein
MTAASRVAAPLGREHMPGNFDISLASYTRRGTAREARIPDDFGPQQSMRGFEETYRNIVDYIVRITYRIWEDRDVEYIANTYAANSQVFDDYGLQRGCRKIIQDTHHTTGAFSDIQLIADEIVWAGDDEVGYHTSHRTIIRGTNDGDSRYGPATSRPIDVLVIANCVALENEIFLEHVLYNNSSMLHQLGHSLGDVVATLATAPPPGWPRDHATWEALRSSARPAKPISITQTIAGFDVDAFTRETFAQLWNARDYAAISNAYSADFAFAGPTDRKFRGAKQYQNLIATLLRAFPDLELQVDEVYWMGNEQDGYITSARWSAEASHAGPGLYGEATNKPVQIWGITQQQIVDGKIVAEWMLFNELDLMMQIAAGRSQG